jgi:hypothetical protein
LFVGARLVQKTKLKKVSGVAQNFQLTPLRTAKKANEYEIYRFVRMALNLLQSTWEVNSVKIEVRGCPEGLYRKICRESKT